MGCEYCMPGCSYRHDLGGTRRYADGADTLRRQSGLLRFLIFCRAQKSSGGLESEGSTTSSDTSRRRHHRRQKDEISGYPPRYRSEDLCRDRIASHAGDAPRRRNRTSQSAQNHAGKDFGIELSVQSGEELRVCIRTSKIRHLVCSGTIAACGQTGCISPHSMQRSASFTARPLRTRTAAVGHARMHDMHPSHRSTSKRSEWWYCAMMCSPMQPESLLYKGESPVQRVS